MDISFSISGKTLNPAIVTEALKIEPTEIWRCKPSVAAQSPELDVVSWIYQLENVESICFDEGTNRILDLFLPVLKQIQNLIAEFGYTVFVQVVPRGAQREFVTILNAGTVTKLAQIGASWNCALDRVD
jgi:hypothetical protein